MMTRLRLAIRCYMLVGVIAVCAPSTTHAQDCVLTFRSTEEENTITLEEGQNVEQFVKHLVWATNRGSRDMELQVKGLETVWERLNAGDDKPYLGTVDLLRAACLSSEGGQLAKTTEDGGEEKSDDPPKCTLFDAPYPKVIENVVARRDGVKIKDALSISPVGGSTPLVARRGLRTTFEVLGNGIEWNRLSDIALVDPFSGREDRGTLLALTGRPGAFSGRVSLAIEPSGRTDLSSPHRRLLFKHPMGCHRVDVVFTRTGVITSVEEDPPFPESGTFKRVTIKGDDIGNAVVRIRGASSQAADMAVVENTDQEIALEVQPVNATLTSAELEIWDRSLGLNRPSSYLGYRTGESEAVKLSWNPCISSPSRPAPTPISPEDGWRGFGTCGNGCMRFSWQIPSGWPAGEKTVLRVADSSGSFSRTEVLDRSITTFQIGAIPLGRTYSWTLKASNCGQASPTNTRTFELIQQ